MNNNRIWSVYIHICPNNKKYIGITSQEPSRRWQNGYGYKGQVFYKAIEKYGWDNIEHKILFKNLTDIEAYSKEKFLIKYYNTYIKNKNCMGYNVTLGGEGNMGFVCSKEQRLKHSKFMSGKNNPMYGKKVSKETIEKRKKTLDKKIKNGEIVYRKGWHHTEETKRKMSISKVGKNNPMYGTISPSRYKKHTEAERKLMRENSKNSNKIICENVEFLSIYECAEHYNVKHTTMNAWLNGQNKMPKKWQEKGLKYKDIELRNKTRYK